MESLYLWNLTSAPAWVGVRRFNLLTDPQDIRSFEYINASGLGAGFIEAVPGIVYNLSGEANQDCIQMTSEGSEWSNVLCASSVHQLRRVCELEPDCGVGTYNSFDPAQPCAGCDYYCLAGAYMVDCAGYNRGVCIPCESGMHKPLPGPTICEPCDLHCGAGMEKLDCGPITAGSCTECPEGKYKDSNGTAPCSTCDYACDAGAQVVGCGGTSSGSCAACPEGSFKTWSGTGQCSSCNYVCDAGKEVRGCGVSSEGSCSPCDSGTFKVLNGSEACTSCGAFVCAAGTETTGCGLASPGRCGACAPGTYKTESGTHDCKQCTDGSLDGIVQGTVVSSFVELPSGASFGDGYVLHESKTEDGLYTAWDFPSSLEAPMQSDNGDFAVHTRVYFENLGSTKVSFVFWSGSRARYELCMDCGDTIVAQWRTSSLKKVVPRVGVIDPETWYDIELIRQAGMLFVLVDGIEVYHDPNVRFNFGVSAVGWRAWESNMRIETLTVTYNNLFCPAGFETVGCGDFSPGECRGCLAGTYKSAGGNGACDDCDLFCTEGFESIGCGGVSPGFCAACPEGKFKNVAGTQSCLACGACGVGELRVECTGPSAGRCVDASWVNECQDQSDDCDDVSQESTCARESVCMCARNDFVVLVAGAGDVHQHRQQL